MTQIAPKYHFLVEQILDKSESKVGSDLECTQLCNNLGSPFVPFFKNFRPDFSANFKPLKEWRKKIIEEDDDAKVPMKGTGVIYCMCNFSCEKNRISKS